MRAVTRAICTLGDLADCRVVETEEVPAVERLGVDTVQVSHSTRQIRLGRLKEEVVVVGNATRC